MSTIGEGKSCKSKDQDPRKRKPKYNLKEVLYQILGQCKNFTLFTKISPHNFFYYIHFRCKSCYIIGHFSLSTS